MAIEKVAEISINNPVLKGSLPKTWVVLQDRSGPIASSTPAFDMLEIYKGDLIMSKADKPINMLEVRAIASATGLTLEQMGDTVARQILLASAGRRAAGEELGKISIDGYTPTQELKVLQSAKSPEVYTLVKSGGIDQAPITTNDLTPEQLGSVIAQHIKERNFRPSIASGIAA